MTYVEKQKIESKKLLVLDVATMWNFTYLMLEATCKFETYFNRIEEADAQYVSYFVDITLQVSDWEKACVFVQFLKVFYDITLTFKSSLKVSSNLIFHEFSKIDELLLDWMVDKYEILNGMSDSMKVKLNK